MSKIGADLPGLQNLIKRDPQVYREEFLQQYAHFQTELELFKMNAAEPAVAFVNLINFLGQVANCYPDDLKDFPSLLFGLMDELAEVMHRDTRINIVKVLILMRNKGLIDVIPLLKSFFNYFRINDKQLRALIYSHIITDISSANKGKINENLNRQLKSFMFDLLESDSDLIARKALDVMVELYRRQVWTDARSVNVIATACLSKYPRVSTGGIRFFLGIETRIEEDEEKERVVEEEEIDHHNHSHKTKSRERDTQRQIQQRRKKLRKANTTESNPRFPAIALVYDPQGFTEKMLNKLKGTREQFSIRLLMMDLISRFIGYHKLCVFPFYTFIQSYLTAHQQQVTRILVFLVQACHDYVPPEELMPLVRILADNFVSDHSQPEVIALGINTISEIFLRIPLLFEEEELEPLIQEIVEYKSYKDKGVVIAARNFMNNAREIYPSCLKKKDRGKDNDKTKRPLAYGEEYVRDYMSGMEALGKAIEEGKVGVEEGGAASWAEKKVERNLEGEIKTRKKLKPVKLTKQQLEDALKKNRSEEKEDEEDEELLEDEEDGEEEEMEEGEEEEMEEGEEEEMEEGEEEMEEGEEEEMDEEEEGDEMDEEEMEEGEEEEEMDEEEEEKESKKAKTKKSKSKEEEEEIDEEEMDPEEREQLRQQRIARAREVLSNRILSPKDFRIIQGKDSDDNDESDESEDDDAEVANARQHSAVVNPADLLGYHKKRKDSIEERRRKAIEGRQRFQSKVKGGGTTNKEKERKKNFQMVKQSNRVKNKLKQSIRDQQQAAKRQVRRLQVLGKKANKRRRI